MLTVIPVARGYLVLYRGKADTETASDFMAKATNMTGERWFFLNEAELVSKEQIASLRKLLNEGEDDA